MQIDHENEERRTRSILNIQFKGVKVENWSKLSSKIRTTELQPKITGSYKRKECIEIIVWIFLDDIHYETNRIFIII